MDVRLENIELAVVNETEVLGVIDRTYRRTDEIKNIAQELETEIGDAVDFGALSEAIAYRHEDLADRLRRGGPLPEHRRCCLEGNAVRDERARIDGSRFKQRDDGRQLVGRVARAKDRHFLQHDQPRLERHLAF